MHQQLWVTRKDVIACEARKLGMDRQLVAARKLGNSECINFWRLASSETWNASITWGGLEARKLGMHLVVARCNTIFSLKTVEHTWILFCCLSSRKLSEVLFISFYHVTNVY
ncbi:hypothetical protein KFK09_006968 [Dendrobium nobile]|uniref:Uncharacterized protein n=1 Tax=Dendrobium nobile TaxID=94219 RepID=A0A8T3BT13_DENNO|nr:hypothetical protein KFK09_006968 [Dendrobium nobile]